MDEGSPIAANSHKCDDILAFRKTSLAGGPVTCVSFPSTEFYLCARGPYLERHFVPNGTESERYLLFPEGGVIHGLRNCPRRKEIAVSQYSAVFGGRRIAFVKHALDKNESIQSIFVEKISAAANVKACPHLEIADWVWDLQFVVTDPSNDVDTTFHMIVGVAHNMLEVWNVVFSTDRVVHAKLNYQICGSKVCLITSMHILPSSQQKIMVAAGTAFHDIIVWPDVDLTSMTDLEGVGDSDDKSDQLISGMDMPYSLKGHKGLVHSVKFLPDGTSLISTSDDRSVRLWRRQANQAGDHDWTLAWTGWGHSARVWRATFCPILKVVLSTGEDGTARIWSIKNGHEIAVVHSSCHCVWTVDTCGTLAITGGNDGSVSFYDLSCKILASNNEEGRLQIDSFQVPDDRPESCANDKDPADMDIGDKHLKNQEGTNKLGSQIQCEANTSNGKTKKKRKMGRINNQVIVGMKWCKKTSNSDIPKLVVATRSGSLMSLCVGRSQWETLTPWWDESLVELHGIKPVEGCCMAVHPSGELVAIGTTKGDIVLTVLGSDKRQRFVLSSARHLKSIQGLDWADHSSLISFHVRTVRWWTFPSLDGLGGGDIETETSVVTLSLGTNAVPKSFAYDEKTNRLCVGDCRGNLALFHLGKNTNIADGSSKHLEPSVLLHRVHQKEHVTDILFKSNKVLSVGNDGCLHLSYCHGSSLRKGWSIPVGSLSGISRVWTLGKDSNAKILVTGYYGNWFVLMDALSGYELFRADTGGRQRINDCFIDFSSSDMLNYPLQYALAVCVNHKNGRNDVLLQRLVPCSQKVQSSVTPFGGLHYSRTVTFHGETIFSACLFSIGRTSRASVLLTGSEDCTSKISVVRSATTGDGSLLDSISLTPQESCVRAVCSSQQDESSALLVVGGGKLVLQFFHVSQDEANRAANGTDGLIVKFLGNGRTDLKAAIDHRINAVSAVPLEGEETVHLVVSGDSNGACRLFVVPENIESRHVLGTLLFSGSRPILSVEIVRIGSRLLLLIGTTGGDVSFWDLPNCVDDFQIQEDDLLKGISHLGTYQAHQMGTNSISASLVETHDSNGVLQASVLICSGGDDQAICLCDGKFILRSQGNLELVGELCVYKTKEASSSAIKGVKQLNHEGRNECRRIVSVGYSQNLAVWQYSRKNPGKLVLLDNAPVDVGDVNCLATQHTMDSNFEIVVGGLGVELFSLVSS